jgi:HPt (histidine-containing phosphotransfer) domain-containing protein
MAGDRQRCLDAGMDAYVSKPFQQELLLQAIATVIGIERADAGNRSLRSEGSPKLVDWSAAIEQVMNDQELLKDVARTSLDETREMLSRLPAAIEAGNARETQRLAHTVKSAMGFFHSITAKQCGQELEDQAATGALGPAPELFERFKAAVDRVTPILQRFVDTGEM